MSAKLKEQRAVVKNPILLWLLIHGGDPGPDDPGPVGQLTSVLSIHELASQLSDNSLRREIQAVTSKAVAKISQRIAKG
ncbi:MAG TPA: hypothetical protein VNN73_22420 [Blastocatellia bacterium]|nr:hypothetical protein [Blastocatellia bacterium]